MNMTSFSKSAQDFQSVSRLALLGDKERWRTMVNSSMFDVDGSLAAGQYEVCIFKTRDVLIGATAAFMSEVGLLVESYFATAEVLRDYAPELSSELEALLRGPVAVSAASCDSWVKSCVTFVEEKLGVSVGGLSRRDMTRFDLHLRHTDELLRHLNIDSRLSEDLQAD